MKDNLKDIRKKVKYILELRYPPLVNIFDKKGEILNKIFPIFKSKMEQWRVQDSQVIIADSFSSMTKQLAIGHLKSSISYEDPSTLQEYIDDSHRFLKELKKFFPELAEASRLGFRVISILEDGKSKNFQDVSDKIRNQFLANPFPSKIDFNDLRITLTGEQFNLTIGPVKKGEDWIKTVFSNPLEGTPEFGIGIDVDSYVKDIDCSNERDLINALIKIQALSFSIEIDLIQNVL